MGFVVYFPLKRNVTLKHANTEILAKKSEFRPCENPINFNGYFFDMHDRDILIRK